jgi:hypothetical protein
VTTKNGTAAGLGNGLVLEQTCQVGRADATDWLNRLPPGSIDLVFTSPDYPYSRTYQEAGCDPGIVKDVDTWVREMVPTFMAALRCCRGLVCFVVDSPTRRFRWTAAPVLLAADLVRQGVCLRKPPLYNRVGIFGGGGNSRRHAAAGGSADWLRNDYEFVICGTAKAGPLPWGDALAMGQPPKYPPGGDPSHRRRDGRRVRAGRYVPPARANPGNVIRCRAGGGHMGSDLAHLNEAPFPESLAEFFVRSFCPPGVVVADPFCGSGTTLAVARRWGRVGVGCDIRQSQVDLTLRRLAEVTPALFT